MSRSRNSLYFEEFNKGDVFFSERHMVTDSDIEVFADISGDDNPIHLSDEAGSSSIYGKRIAHGLLTLSVASGLATKLGFARDTTIAFRGLDWKFKVPVYLGDCIRATFEVIEKRSVPLKEGGLIVFKVEVRNQEDQLVQSGRWRLIVKKREKA